MQHILLLSQYRDYKAAEPVDHFTITAAELEDFTAKLGSQIEYTFNRLKQTTKPPSMVQNQQPPGQRTPAQPPPQPQKLTAESLKLNEDQEAKSRAASLQKNQDNNKPPAAPTAAHPPYPWGQVSPDGRAVYAGENRVTRETLKFPANKRRKNNQSSAANTPITNAQTPPINQASPPKIESPVMTKAPPPPKIKCPVEGCKSKATFTSQAELNKHMDDAHPPKEETITDPLAYCLESLRIVLDLDDDGKSKPVDRKPAAPTTTSQSIKQESATPMSRNTTGPSTPGNPLLKTPLTNNNNMVKTPQSYTTAAAVKSSTPSKSLLHPNLPNGSSNSTNNTTTAALSNSTAEQDPWANCLVTEEWFRTVFAPVRHLDHPVSPAWLSQYCIRQAQDDPGAPLNMLEREQRANKAQARGPAAAANGVAGGNVDLSPPTTGTGIGNRDPTPRSSDIHTSDDLNVAVAVDLAGSAPGSGSRGKGAESNEFDKMEEEGWGLPFDEEEALADFDVDQDPNDIFEMLGRADEHPGGESGMVVGGKETDQDPGLDPLLEMEWETAFGPVDEKEVDRLARPENADEEFLRYFNPRELERRREGERRGRR